ncbi:hypothetical protein CO151_06500 [bacterium CG_4_9_14_3_um_filter_65_15]|nr:MAG: hypothetical protein CO151_06500 [bacterium CG_4_9_14_3_um_filter_65_15]
METVLRVFPNRDGPWLVRAGPVILGVPEQIGSRLRPLDGTRPEPAELRCLLRPHDHRGALAERLHGGLVPPPFSWRRFLSSRFPVWVRVPLVSPSVVGGLAERSARWGRPRALLGLGALGAAGVVLSDWNSPSGEVSATALAAGAILFVVSALWHELGHAAALREAGYHPGGLGLGMLMILPVLFVDVTPVALLPRRKRLRVNVAGPVFQLALAAVYRLLATLPLPPTVGAGVHIAAVSATFAVSWSLWPFVRSDGYWLLCDALDIPRLDQPLPADRPRTTRILAGILRVLNVVFLAGVGIILTRTMHHRWGLVGLPDCSGGSWAATSAALAIWAALIPRTLLLMRLTIRDLRT